MRVAVSSPESRCGLCSDRPVIHSSANERPAYAVSMLSSHSQLVLAHPFNVAFGSRAAVVRCGEGVSLAPESRPTPSSIDHLFSANCRHPANPPNHPQSNPSQSSSLSDGSCPILLKNSIDAVYWQLSEGFLAVPHVSKLLELLNQHWAVSTHNRLQRARSGVFQRIGRVGV
jgi:hypothetical protein